MMKPQIFSIVDTVATEYSWLSEYEKYFAKFQQRKLFHKYKFEEKSSVVKKHYFAHAQRFISKYPSIFFFDKKLPENRMNLFLSAQIIRSDPEVSDNIIENNVDSPSKYNFVDKRFLEKAYSSTTSIPLNMLRTVNVYTYEAKSLNKKLGVSPCGAGELLSILVELSDCTLATFDEEDVFNAIKAKSEKKVDLEKKYLETFDALLSKRGMSKIFGATCPKRNYKKMSLAIFEKEMAWILHNSICSFLSVTSEELQKSDRESVLFQLVQKNSRCYSLIDYMPKNYKDFFNHLKSSSFPFQISGKLIKKTVRNVMKNLTKELAKGSNGKFSKPIDKEISRFKYRIRYMNVGARTKQTLLGAASSAVVISSASNGFEREPFDQLIDLFLAMHEKGINENEIRNLISKLYDPERFIDDYTITQEAHDIFERYVPDLLSLFKKLPKGMQYKKVYNKIIKLVVSELGGSSVRTSSMRALCSKLPSKIDSILNENFNSISALVGLLAFTRDQEQNVINQISESGIVSFDNEQNLFKRIREMGLGDNIGKIIKNYKQKDTSEALLKEPIIKNIGRLSFALVPHNYDISLLAVGVNGVCIPPGSHPHKQQHRKECVNLIVYDDNEIYLWGLMVKAKEKYKWFLNNFQGRVPNRYAKFKQEIKNACIDLMSEVGDVYMDEHYFNTIHLHSGLKEIEVKELTLPKMRLDIYQDSEGKINEKTLYEIPMKASDNHAIR